MKRNLITLLFMILLHAITYAAVRTVNNTNTGAAQFLQIDAAIAASSPGDTIYVTKSTTTYNSCTVSKSITLLGPGTFAQTQISYPTVLNQISINNNITGITIRGFKIVANMVGANSNVHQLSISDNYFQACGIYIGGITNCSDYSVSNNIFGGDIYAYNGGGSFNFIVLNNIFAASKITDFNFPNGLVQNNTFCNSANGNAFGSFNATPTGLLIKNNIFYNAHPINFTTSCTFLNNISYSTTATYPVLGGTNIDNVDPQFVNVAASGGFNKNYNYSVQTTSPAHNAGSDGTDMGFYGGGIHASEKGEPQFVPVIREMNLENNNVSLNGNVNLKVRSTKAR